MGAQRAMLNLAVSPYHLSTRESVAAVALTLADRAVTILPEPAEGRTREDVRAAVDRLPRFLRVLESWRWSGPLWNAGIIAAGVRGSRAGELAFAQVADAGRAVFNDAAFASLKAGSLAVPPSLRAAGGEPAGDASTASGEAADRWLDAICTDLLRGGPDPRLSTTIVAALDRFAAEHGLVAVRGPTDSLTQRAETRLTRKVFSIAVPVMSRAAGGKILDMRQQLAAPLTKLRGSMSAALKEPSQEPESHRDALAAAAGDYAESFEAWYARAARDDENDQRTMRDFVSLTGVFLPADCALVSARAAMRGVARAGGRSARGSTNKADEAEPGVLRALLIRPMNVRPA